MTKHHSLVLGAAAALAFALGAPAAAEDLRQPLSATQVIDLTHELHDDMAFWPGGVGFKKIKLLDYDGGYLFHKFETGENAGTHVDAPVHFVEGKLPIDQLALRDLIVPAVVIDVQDKVAGNPDYALSAADVTAWEAEHGKVPAGALVILNTGWYKRFDEPAKYANVDADNVLHFPGYGPDAARLLVERDVAGIGIDTLSLDPGQAKVFETHLIMLGADKYQIENLANLDALPATGATVVVGVLPVRDGSQAQARVLALLP